MLILTAQGKHNCKERKMARVETFGFTLAMMLTGFITFTALPFA